MSDDLRTQVRKWFVETGYIDGGGVGYWDSTKESVEVGSEAAAKALRDEWLEQGKLERTSWGELRPTFSYGVFRIMSIWVDVPNPLADRIEELEAKLEALDHAYDSIVQAFRFEALRTDDAESKLAKAVDALKGSRETILQLVNSRNSEAEGTDEDWVGDIDDTLAEIKGEQP